MGDLILLDPEDHVLKNYMDRDKGIPHSPF